MKYLFYQTSWIILFVYYLSINLFISQIESVPVSPTFNTVPNCFGARNNCLRIDYFKFNASIQVGQPVLDDSVPTYVFTKSLGKIYRDIKIITTCFTSFQSTVDYWFGFEIDATYSGNPTSSVSVHVKILQNSSFALIGLNVMIVTDPLAKIMTVLYYTLEDAGVFVFQNVTVPVSNNIFLLTKYFKGKANNDRFMLNPMDFNVSSTYIGVALSSWIFAVDTTIDYQLKAFVILMDITKKPTVPELVSIGWGAYYQHDNIFPTTTFNINNGIQTSDYRLRCIIGYHRVDMINRTLPYFLFDIDSTGIVNGSYNAVGNCWKISSICYRDRGCPPTHLFQKPTSALCYNCPSTSGVNMTAADYNAIPATICNTSDHAYQIDNTQDYIIVRVCYKCTSCQDHYLALNFVCVLCNQRYLYCDTCNQTIACLTCFPGFTFNPLNRCVLCAAQIPFCQMCIGLICSQCFAEYFLDTNVCYLCQNLWTGCYSCNSSAVCNTCYPNYYMDNYLCYKCLDYMYQCATCTSNTSCTSCTPAYQFDATGSCVPKLVGCISVLYNGVKDTCLACDGSAGFIYLVAKKICQCESGSILNSNLQPMKCIPTCGDGIVGSTESCDDANLKDNDGCSSLCIVQNNYICSRQSPSKCVVQMNFTYFEFLYAQKSKGQNKATMFFMILPPFKGLQSVDWSKLLSLKLGNTKIDPSLFSAKYDFQSSTLKIIFSYSQILQHKTMTCLLNFLPDIVVSIPSTFQSTFTMQGLNEPLIYQSQQLRKLYQVTSMVSLIIMSLMLVQFFVGSYLNKMIGLETIQVAQLIYFLRMLTKREHASFLNSINEFKYTAFGGYDGHQLIFTLSKESLQTKAVIDGLANKFYIGIDLEKYFLINVNFSLIPMLLAMIIYLIVLAKKYWIRSQYIEHRIMQTKDRYTIQKRSSQGVYENFFFPYVMLFNFILLYNTMYCLQTTTNTPYSPGTISPSFPQSDKLINQVKQLTTYSFMFNTFLLFLNFGIYCFEVFNSYQQYIRANLTQEQKGNMPYSLIEKLQHDENDLQLKKNYQPLYCLIYLIYYFLITLVIIVQIRYNKQFQYGLQVITGICALYLIFIWFWKPYKSESNSQNYFLKVNHLSTLLILVVFVCLQRLPTFPTNWIIFCMSLVTSLLFLIMAGGFIRILIQYRFNKLVDDNLITQSKGKQKNQEWNDMKNYLKNNNTNIFLFKNQIKDEIQIQSKLTNIETRNNQNNKFRTDSNKQLYGKPQLKKTFPNKDIQKDNKEYLEFQNKRKQSINSINSIKNEQKVNHIKKQQKPNSTMKVGQQKLRKRMQNQLQIKRKEQLQNNDEHSPDILNKPNNYSHQYENQAKQKLSALLKQKMIKFNAQKKPI